MSNYVLNEILWEFTLKCNKNCKYCGSKNNLNKEEDIYRIHIAKEISYITLKSVAAKWTLDALLTIGIPVEGSTEEEKLKLKSRQEEQCN